MSAETPIARAIVGSDRPAADAAGWTDATSLAPHARFWGRADEAMRIVTEAGVVCARSVLVAFTRDELRNDRIATLGLDSVGVAPSPAGTIRVDSAGRAARGLFACGAAADRSRIAPAAQFAATLGVDVALARAVRAAREHERARPPYASIVRAAPGDESVWDFPRPPRVERVDARVRVAIGNATIADTRDAVRVLETAGAPVVYVPLRDVHADVHVTTELGLCEWKGVFAYCDVIHGGTRIDGAGWTFVTPFDDLGRGYAALRGSIGFYPAKVTCEVDGVRVDPQPGEYYGGWVTDRICGPIKGVPGSANW